MSLPVDRRRLRVPVKRIIIINRTDDAVACQVIGINMQTYWLKGSRQRVGAYDDHVLFYK